MSKQNNTNETPKQVVLRILKELLKDAPQQLEGMKAQLKMAKVITEAIPSETPQKILDAQAKAEEAMAGIEYDMEMITLYVKENS